MGAIDSLPAILQQIFAHISSVLDFQVLALGKGGYRLSVGALLGAIAVILLARMFSRLVQQGIDRYAASNEHSNRASLYTVSRVTHYSILTLGVLIALGFAGIPVSKLTLIAGGLGVGLGFGLQAIFNNFVSGLILLFDRTLKVGDFVELASGVHGTVQAIKIRATRINTNDDVDILVPNSEFVSGRLVNWTLQEATRRLRIPFGVAYGSSKEKVKAAALDAAAAVSFTQALKGPHAPQVWLTGFGDSSLNFELVVWVNAEATRRPSRAKAAYNWALETAIRAHGCAAGSAWKVKRPGRQLPNYWSPMPVRFPRTQKMMRPIHRTVRHHGPKMMRSVICRHPRRSTPRHPGATPELAVFLSVIFPRITAWLELLRAKCRTSAVSQRGR